MLPTAPALFPFFYFESPWAGIAPKPRTNLAQLRNWAKVALVGPVLPESVLKKWVCKKWQTVHIHEILLTCQKNVHNC
jgi:hypothetical protein